MQTPPDTTPTADTAAPKRPTRKPAARKPTKRKAAKRTSKAPSQTPAIAPHTAIAITRRRDMALATAATWIAQGEDVSRVLSDLYTMAANNTHHDLGLPSVFRAA